MPGIYPPFIVPSLSTITCTTSFRISLARLSTQGSDGIPLVVCLSECLRADASRDHPQSKTDSKRGLTMLKDSSPAIHSNGNNTGKWADQATARARTSTWRNVNVVLVGWQGGRGDWHIRIRSKSGLWLAGIGDHEPRLVSDIHSRLFLERLSR
jgi:hypothetical protein